MTNTNAIRPEFKTKKTLYRAVYLNLKTRTTREFIFSLPKRDIVPESRAIEILDIKGLSNEDYRNLRVEPME